jgi:prophage regulatory protein
MATEHSNTSPQILRLKKVKELTGLSKSTIYAEIQAGNFPKQFPITSKRCVGWDAAAVRNLVQSRINSSNNQMNGAI